MSAILYNVEPVECLDCGAPITVRRYEDSFDIYHGAVGAGYTPADVQRIADGDVGMAIVRVVEAWRGRCQSGTAGYRKPLAGPPPLEAEELTQ